MRTRDLQLFLLFPLLGFCLGQNETESFNYTQPCSMGHIFCADNAVCSSPDNVTEICECKEDYSGDPYRSENNTECIPEKYPCAIDSADTDCHPDAYCDGFCKCNSGLIGDGKTECKDVNECTEGFPNNTRPCDPNAHCQNTFGSYRCTCKSNYRGDGFNCTHFCHSDGDCDMNAFCNQTSSKCVCNEHYTGNGTHCYDINECEEDPCDANADCVNLDGSYECNCRNGYNGNGKTCQKTPKTCEEIRLKDSNAKSGNYLIDPDGVGPINATEVYCQMESDRGITIIKSLIDNPTRLFNSNPDVNVTYASSLEQILAIINSSNECYQEVNSICRYKAIMMDGDDYYIDGQGNIRRSWGHTQAGYDGYCACGLIHACHNTSAKCNCDGTASKREDYGKIFDKDILPIQYLHFRFENSYQKFDFEIGDVVCSPKPTEYPRDCNEAKKDYGITTSGAVLIDVDGTDSSGIEPQLVYCDMDTYPHTAITVIPHNRPYPVKITEEGEYNITYAVKDKFLEKLVEVSPFCRQDVSFTCTNLPLMRNGDTYFTNFEGEKQNYWPGGLGIEGKCACGVIGTCVDESYGCDCDKMDGVTRKDFGPVLEKESLPVGSLVFNEVGNGSSGEFHVDFLRCSPFEFAFEANCQQYKTDGHTDSYAYVIDPDGPKMSDGDNENVPPFMVECEMVEEPPHGKTILHHENEELIDFSGSVSFYYNVTAQQIEKLRQRSIYCTQSFQFQCKNAPFNDQDGNPLIQWYDVDNIAHAYFTGQEGGGCACGVGYACAGNHTCNCDMNDGELRFDEGVITNKDQLPISKIEASYESGTSTSQIEVGPLVCTENFPTCADQFNFMYWHRNKDEYRPTNGEFTIDPDGPGELDPFKVQCNFPMTRVPIGAEIFNITQRNLPDDPGPKTKCFDISYPYIGNPDQLQALIDRSKICVQHIQFKCVNAPITDNVYYTNCKNERQPGFGGSGGKDMCKCGTTGTCDGNTTSKCNCDVEDGEERVDGGWIRLKEHLPVCNICITLQGPTPEADHRSGSYILSELECSGYPLGYYSSCQDRRNRGETTSDTVNIDLDTAFSGLPEFLVYCNYDGFPAVGNEEILPKETIINVTKEERIVYFYYIVENITLIEYLVEASVYCEQELYILCNGAPVPTSDAGRKMLDLDYDGTAITCKEGLCSCSENGQEVFGGFITVQKALPAEGVSLPESQGTRQVHVGNMKCYNVYKNCDAIKKAGADKNPLKNNIYAIDPDGAGGVAIFPATCDFDTIPGSGITEIPIEGPGQKLKITISGQPDENHTEHPIEYPDATPEQINVLAKTSSFCYQSVLYECKEAPLNDNGTPTSYYNTYNGSASPSFGAGFYTDTPGCACHLTGTCPGNHSCHCDAKGPMTDMDSGIVSDPEALPITQMNFVGPFEDQAEATATISNVRCGEEPFDLPKDCEDALEKGYVTGEVMIWPSANEKPFYVYCNMDILPGHGVIVIRNNLEEGVVIKEPGDVKVTYNNVTDEQVKIVTEISAYCYLPVKYDCYNTHFLGYNDFEFIGSDVNPKTYFGAGISNQCTCGNSRQCGGDEPKSVLLNRKCSCDAGDQVWRRDAGVMSAKDDLPVFSMKFGDPGRINSTGIMTFGSLYCSTEELDLNECEMDFHDCHENATCQNTVGGFKCSCKVGYKGGMVPDVWANGRVCYDDNECEFGRCPYSANCTNTMGSFFCTCKHGYKKTGETSCEDIDECATNTHNCDPHARCINRDGGFACQCKRGYIGDGRTCESIGLCTCFGDPHCLSFDQKWLHFQGACQYHMARDGCYGEPPTFEVLAEFWDQDKDIEDATWVKSVIVKIHGATIELMQQNEVRVDGYTRTLPYHKGKNFSLRKKGNYVELNTDWGLAVSWDGDQVVEIRVLKDYRNQTCGLCGNYNQIKEDDWTLGPSCPNEGQITENFNEFGSSHADMSYVAQNPQCKHDCNKPPEKNTCTGDDEAKARYYCDMIFNPNGVFKNCLENMPDEDRQNYHDQSCMYDVCNNPEDRKGAVCNVAVQLVKDCQNNYNETVEDFESLELCATDCAPGKEYLICADSERLITCESLLHSDNITVPTSDECQAGCYCEEGLVMDGDNCVEPSECGCYYNKTYYSAGEVITVENCTEKWTCSSNETFEVETLSCDGNATCKLKDGFYGCHCNAGYKGDGTECTFDPCASNPCSGKHQTCIAQPDGYTCECQMGFQGDCTDCEDIDECLTKQDSCPKHSRCINTEGSYRCECWKGFERVEDGCEDENECEIGIDDCDRAHEKCYNRIGGYHCEPCKDKECCACLSYNCHRFGEVCASNKTHTKTFSSPAEMKIEACEKQEHWHINYEGMCKSSSCGGVTCISMYQKCEMINGMPTCVCQNCTEEEKIQKPVCTDRLEIYPTKCVFKQIMCFLHRNDILEETMQPCEDHENGEPPFTTWVPWSNCSEPCGVGNQTRKREPLVELNEFQQEKYPTEETKICYGDPCVNSVCEGVSCHGIEQVCVVIEGDNEDMANCTCPDCTGAEEDPVCATVGEEKRTTFKNLCEVKANACDKNETYDVLHVGECGVKPLNCTKMPLTRKYSETGCTPVEVDVGKCDGGCGASPDRCCQPVTKSNHTIAFTCQGDEARESVIEVIEGCRCIDLPEPAN